VLKPELFAMNFVNSPKNYLYAKVSQKQRTNKVGGDHSSAALLENAEGDDSIYSFKIGSRFCRIHEQEPLFKNFVAKASTELITGENTSLLKSKFFSRLTHKVNDYPIYG